MEERAAVRGGQSVAPTLRTIEGERSIRQLSRRRKRHQHADCRGGQPDRRLNAAGQCCL